MSSNDQHTLSIAILGTDAVLAARPASAIQLAHAVLKVGYDAVYPASWGDELVAAGCLQRIGERDGGSVVLCACPLVAQRLLRSGDDIVPRLVPLVSPPVAVARYLRALYAGRPLHITYMGACPDADAAEIDARLAPAELEGELQGRGIVPTRQPQYFESVLPPDRRRFYSLPGGAPAPNWLKSSVHPRALLTLTGEDLAAELAQALLTGEPSLIDVAPMLGCVCSGAGEQRAPAAAREEAASIDPPRSPSPIIDSSLPIELDRQLPAPTTPDPGQREMFGDQGAIDADRAVAAMSNEQAGRTAQGAAEMSGGEAPPDEGPGELLHSYSRANRSPGATPAASGSPTRRTPPFVTPVPPPIREAPASAPSPPVTRAEGSGGGSVEGTTVGRDAAPSPDWDQTSNIAVAIDLLQNVRLFPERTAADEEPTPPLATDSDEEGNPPATSVRRPTPASVRRIASSTPVVRTGNGRSMPRAYAAHRKSSPPRADGSPPERETKIERSSEPLAPPADFRPPIVPRSDRSGQPMTARPTHDAPRQTASAAPASSRDGGTGDAASSSPRMALPPRPQSMVRHQTLTLRSPGRSHHAPPPRRRSRAAGLLVAIAIVTVGAISLLAVRHLVARDQPATEAAVVSEGVSDIEQRTTEGERAPAAERDSTALSAASGDTPDGVAQSPEHPPAPDQQ